MPENNSTSLTRLIGAAGLAFVARAVEDVSRFEKGLWREGRRAREEEGVALTINNLVCRY